jgi:predicted esterase
MLLSFFMALGASARIRVTRGLAYGGRADAKLDVYAPVGADGEAPVVVATVGSGRVGQELASRGFVAVVKSGGASHSSRLLFEDLAAVVAWAKANAAAHGGDPQRLFAMGQADGARAAVMLALDPRWLAAAGLGPATLRGAIGLCGIYACEHDEAARYARPAAPPLLLIAGAQDRADTGRLACALRKVGGQVAEIRYPRLGNRPSLHGVLGALRLRATALDEVERFVRLRSLGLG